MEPNIKYCCSDLRQARRSNAIFIISAQSTDENAMCEQYAYGANNTIRYCPYCGKILPEEPF